MKFEQLSISDDLLSALEMLIQNGGPIEKDITTVGNHYLNVRVDTTFKRSLVYVVYVL